MKRNDFDRILDSLESKDVIYPCDIADKLKIPISVVYNHLVLLMEKGIVEVRFRPYCQKCGFFGEVYETFNQIPNEIICPDCGTVYKNPLKNTIVIFQKIK